MASARNYENKLENRNQQRNMKLFLKQMEIIEKYNSKFKAYVE